LPWGVSFTNPYAHEVVGVPLDVKLHPTQLYEAGAEFLIFALLYSRFRKRQFDGQIMGWYLLLYPAARFLVEFVRSHSPEALLFGGLLSDAQVVSLLLFGFGAWLLWLSPYRQRIRPSSVSAAGPAAASVRQRATKLSS
jgi:phosphatidylglycerol:prolipoprotein diacylglycerol transferase